MLARKLLLICLLASCHNRPAQNIPEPITADIAQMRAILERYSPSGHNIVTAYEALPSSFVIQGGNYTISHSGSFPQYFTSKMPDYLVIDMGTAVHETYHMYASSMAYQMLAKNNQAPGLGAKVVSVGKEPMLVSYSKTYAAREMDATFPAEAKTSRYKLYVSSSQESQSTQSSGVFGLLDEFTAYYQDARVTVDLWPWVRDEAKLNTNLTSNYVAALRGIRVPYAEFKLFILHYLLYAKAKQPEVYRGLMANQSFREAFRATESTYSALIQEAERLEPAVHKFAKEHEVDAEIRDGTLFLYGAPNVLKSDERYRTLLKYINSAPYQKILTELK